MFVKNKVVGVAGGKVRLASGDTQSMAIHAGKKEVTAFAGGGYGMGGTPTSVNVIGGATYQYMMTGILPDQDEEQLKRFYRDIYYYDNVAGSAVDIMSTFPFSDWDLMGVDEKRLQVYKDNLERLNIRSMLPEISLAYLTDGYFAGTLVFDQKSGMFVDTLVHDALQTTVKHSPFYNIDPIIRVVTSRATQEFMNDGSGYAKKYLSNLPKEFVNLLKSGSFTLDPLSTVYIPRRTTADKPYVSYLKRILPVYLLEKTLFRGTLVEASRRQRAISHLSIGDDTWVPTPQELMAHINQFQTAELDPLGAWVATRNSVQVQDVRQGGDFWKWTDTADVLVPHKLRALGISEAFLSGDASFATAEAAVSVFIENADSYREFLTNRMFYQKLFPLIAVVNGFFKDKSEKLRQQDRADVLYNTNHRNNLDIPTLQWQKSLQARNEENQFDMLEKLSEKGFPISLKMWASAAGIDVDAALKDLKDDSDLRKRISEITGEPMDQSTQGEDEYSYEESGLIPSRSTANGMSNRIPLLSRTFTEDQSEVKAETKTGKPKYIHNQHLAQREQNANIARIVARMNTDEEYRAQVKAQARKKLGNTYNTRLFG